MFRTFRASTTTVPWLLAMVVLCLWRKSLRALATRICIFATRRIALRRLDEPRFLRLRSRCAFRSAGSAFLPWLTGAMLVPSLNAANTATPMSTPTGGRTDGVGSAASRCHWTATDHFPARRETVVLQISPGIAYQPRRLIHPSFGSLIRPDDLPVRSTLIETG